MREKFTQDLKDAMKAGERAKVDTLRLINAALKDKDIEARGNGRPELAETENGEIAVIASFLPKQMSEDEVKAAIAAAVAETGAASMKDMGKVVGALKAKHSGQMDFAKASGLVKAALGG